MVVDQENIVPQATEEVVVNNAEVVVEPENDLKSSTPLIQMQENPEDNPLIA
jgi:hypothetical protein